ncbi:MAG: hypothetical protein JW976_06130 [Syntrophaceae bacterium]|nr:hypothetical protein [Syntrophaceae bacterium]
MQNKFKFFIPSIADFIFFLLFTILAFQTPSILLIDCDTGLHIRIGEFILNTLSIPKYDIFFSSIPPHKYIDYEWLSQVIMALVHLHLGGLTGVVIFFSFFIAFIYYLLFRILRRENGNIVITTCISLLVICASSIHWQAKPHIFSLLIFIVWYYILDLYQYKNKNYLYTLPAIMLIWVNLHGAFILGFALCGIYLLGNIAQVFLIDETEKAIHKAKTKKLFFIISLLIIASLLNPSGWRGLLQPFTVISNNILTDNISAYSSPNFHNSNILPFEILLLFIIAAFALSKSKQSITEIILVLLFTSMALYSVRNIPFFAITIAPILLRRSEQIPLEKNSRQSIIEIISVIFFTIMALYSAGVLLFVVIIIFALLLYIKKIFTENNGKFTDTPDTDNQNISETNLFLAKDFFWLFLLVIFILALALSGRINHQFDEKIKPLAAIEFLKKENIQGNMYNEYDFGTYIIYSAYPQYRVFIDGRAEMYGAERLKEYYRVRRTEPGWEKVLDKYDINLIIVYHNLSLSQSLLNNNKWRLIYSDTVADIFVRNSLKNKSLIEKYSMKTVIVENIHKNFI